MSRQALTSTKRPRPDRVNILLPLILYSPSGHFLENKEITTPVQSKRLIFKCDNPSVVSVLQNKS